MIIKTLNGETQRQADARGAAVLEKAGDLLSPLDPDGPALIDAIGKRLRGGALHEPITLENVEAVIDALREEFNEIRDIAAADEAMQTRRVWGK